jgi:twinkle protein
MVEELRKLGIEVKSGARGDVKTLCPKCSATRKHRTDPCLSVNVDAGVWNCKNCGWKGKIDTRPKKEYVVPPMGELKKLSQPVIDYFAKRKISNQTLLRYKVSESVQWFPEGEVRPAGETRCIDFNYFIVGGKLVNIKYRTSDKHFKLVPGAMLSLYGVDVACENSNEEIMIVEGEPDVLSWYEAGVKIATSVPNGASKNQKLEWLEEMLPYLEGKKILIGTDMDEPGIALRNELARRLGKSNCYIVTYPEKDANETLMNHGPEVLRDCYLNAQPFPVEGIDRVTEDQLMNLYEQGYPEGYETGWSNMDDHISWLPGMVTLITGIPGHGKTTWLKNWLVRMAERHGHSFLIYSAEEASAEFAYTDLLSIRLGKTFFNAPNAHRITKDEIKQYTPWLNEHFYYYKLSENESTVEAIIAKAKEMVKRTGIRGLVIDNMSTIERQLGNSNRHNAVGDIMRDLRNFAREYGLFIFIIAHPKKMDKEKEGKIKGDYEPPTGYDVGDSSHYYNAPDYGVTVFRNKKTRQTEVIFWKVRFKFCGQEGTDFFRYDIPTSRYFEADKLNDGKDKSKFVGQPQTFIQAGTL